jgi:hypothetical protein
MCHPSLIQVTDLANERYEMQTAYKVTWTNWESGSGKDDRYFANYSDATNYVQNYERYGYKAEITTIHIQSVFETVSA